VDHNDEHYGLIKEFHLFICHGVLTETSQLIIQICHISSCLILYPFYLSYLFRFFEAIHVG
jgi:hypothetical protein